uniref:Glucosidase 2 subunit beta n=1 Tax=Rhizochromulina marina TaxID=1034831 RepID=A0A7S2WK79_9STRA
MLRSSSAVPRFRCTDTKGYEPLDVPAHVVGDGICDCCDGSDEAWNDRVQCSNECERMAEEARRADQERQAQLQMGYERFRSYCDIGTRQYEAEFAEMHETRTALERVATEVAELERRKAELSTQQEKERDQRKKDADTVWKQALALPQLNVEQKSTVLLTATIEASDTGMETLMGYLTTHFPSELTDSVDDVEVFSLAAEVSEILNPTDEVVVDPAGEATKAPPPSARTVDTVLAELRQALPLESAPDMDHMVIELLTDLKQFSRGAELSLGMRGETGHGLDFEALANPNSWTLDELAHVEEDLSERQRRQRELENNKQKLDTLEGTDFGLLKEYFVLNGKCFESHVSGFKYSICPFGDAKQDHTSLGKFTTWKDTNVMLFDNGAKCWNGPKRSLQVTFTCGAEDKILSVEEPETCVYAASFLSPAACGHNDERTQPTTTDHRQGPLA